MTRTSAISFVFGVATLLGLVAAQAMIWFYAPEEQTMGLVQKIFYIHVPLAWWGFVAFFLVFLGSLGYLWKKNPSFDIMARAAAEIGVLFFTLVLLTGIIWARASWNTWWTWDPRLSTALVMWFMYCGYLVLRSASLDTHRLKVLCAVLGLVAFLDVPLVFVSARLWRSIHPAVFASKGGGLPPEMGLTVGVNVLVWGGLFVLLVMVRFSQLRLRTAIDEGFARIQFGQGQNGNSEHHM